MLTKHLYFLIASLFLLNLSTSAQSRFSEVTLEPMDDYLKNVFIQVSHGEYHKAVKKHHVKSSQFATPRIGLITFALFEQNHKKDKALLSYTYQKDEQVLIQRIYNETLPVLTDTLQHHAVTLVLPSSLNASQQAAYQEAVSQLQEIASKKVDLIETLTENNLSNTPEGMGYIPNFLDDGMNAEMNAILGKLAVLMDVDALLSVQVSSEYFNYSIAMSNVLMMMHFPDPLQTVAGAPAQKLGNYFYIPADPIGFIGLEKDEVVGEDIAPFSVLISRMAGDFLTILEIERDHLFSK